MDIKTWKIWKVIIAHLRSAQQALPVSTSDNQAEYQRLTKDFEEYLEHNELELALNMLEELGELNLCRGGFWRRMQQAASAMGLDERIEEYRVEYRKSLARLEQMGYRN